MIASQSTPAPSRRLNLRPMSDVKPERVEWLWPGRFPAGKLSIIAGEPGGGKSLLSLDIAARISRGEKWPDDSGTAKQGRTIVLALEDGAADTVRPRLDAAGADVSMVTDLAGVVNSDNTAAGFNLARDAALLEAAIQELGDVRLLIVDPLVGVLGNAQLNREDDVRGALMPLVGLAERTGVAVLGVMHLRKAESDRALFRVSGSGAFVALARAVWMVGTDRDDPEVRLLVPGKLNLTKPGRSMRFTVGGDPKGAGCIEWLGESDATAADTFAPEKRMVAAPKVAQAMEFIRSALADGPRPVAEVKDEAKQSGISAASFERARAQLHVQPMPPDVAQGPWRIALPRLAGSRSRRMSEGVHESA